jgi:hypothetical protein
MKIRRLASSSGVGPSLWKSQMAALGRQSAFDLPTCDSFRRAGAGDSHLDRRASQLTLASPIGRIVDVFGEWRVWSEQSGRSRPKPGGHTFQMLTEKQSPVCVRHETASWPKPRQQKVGGDRF